MCNLATSLPKASTCSDDDDNHDGNVFLSLFNLAIIACPKRPPAVIQIDDDDKDNQDRDNKVSLAPGLQRALTAQSPAQILLLLLPRKKFSIDLTLVVLANL